MPKGKKLAALALGIAFVCTLAAAIWSCGKESENSQAARYRSEADAARQELSEAQRQVQDERGKREAAEKDFTVAAAFAYGAGLALFLLILLLAREVRARRALVSVIQFLQRRHRNGKA